MRTGSLAHIVLAVLAVSRLVTPVHAQAREGLKLYISADMEGVVGVVTGEQLGPSGFEYERARRFMTQEVLAAVRGARAAGVTEIVIGDSHGNGQNLLLEELPRDVTVVRSWPRPLMMMEGIDSTFDAAIFIGYHAGTTNPDGVRAHTMSSANLAALRLNDQFVPEGGLNAAIAGAFGVPVVMVSGDDAAVEEVAHVVGDIEQAVVKWNISFHAARTVTPDSAYALIEATTRRALQRLSDFEPLALAPPIRADVTFKNYRPSQVLAYLPNVERTDAHSIRFVGRDMVEVSRFLEFLLAYRADLAP